MNLPQSIRDLYEVHNYKHAIEVLSAGCKQEFSELVDAPQIMVRDSVKIAYMQ